MFIDESPREANTDCPTCVEYSMHHEKYVKIQTYCLKKVFPKENR